MAARKAEGELKIHAGENLRHVRAFTALRSRVPRTHLHRTSGETRKPDFRLTG